MKEWITGFFDFTKLPTKVLTAVAFVLGLALFSPAWVRNRLSLDEVPKPYNAVMSLTFLLSFGIVVFNGGSWVVGTVRKRHDRKLAKAARERAISKIDWTEKAVLREFMITRRHVVQLPSEDPTVAGLLHRGLIFRVGDEEFDIEGGNFRNYSIDSDAKGILTFELLDFPQGDPTPSEVDRIEQRRPTWAHAVEDFKRRKIKPG